MIKHLVICLGLCMLLAACSGTNSADLTLLDGNDFVLKVDKISEHPNVQFPHSNLKKSDYKETNDGAHYEIIISQDGQTVTIGSDPIQGQKTDDGNGSKKFELDEGTFAGGRFMVWKNKNNLEAELTIYGSGVPIFKSERGLLVPKQ